MSLINDALKRAKQAQQQNPPPVGGPPLKTAGPAEARPASGAKTLIFIMVACVIVGNALLFLALSDRGAKKPAAPVVTALAQPAPAAVPVPAPASEPALTPPSPALNPDLTLNLNPLAPDQAAPLPAVESAEPVATVTNTPEPAPAVVFENPKPAPLRLQSIIYNPAKPSAMIGGKFLSLGDRIQGFRVTAIDQESVTLVGNGQTNVLSLP